MKQNMEALALANERRYAKAALRREISALGRAEGLAAVAEVLRDPPVHVGSQRLIDVLAWPKWMGTSWVAMTIRRSRAGCSHVVRVMDLTERQRLLIADELDRMASPDYDSRVA